MRSLPNCGVQVTQNTVDKYLDDILLETVYTVAHEDTLQEMGLSPAQLTVEGEVAAEGEGAARRASPTKRGAHTLLASQLPSATSAAVPANCQHCRL